MYFTFMLKYYNENHINNKYDKNINALDYM